jgi:hypothetical protein
MQAGVTAMGSGCVSGGAIGGVDGSPRVMLASRSMCCCGLDSLLKALRACSSVSL